MTVFSLLRRLFIVAVFVFVANVNAEKYFTWVDERGQVHNQLIPDSEKSEESFIDSDQLEKQGFNRIEGERPFFVWVDSMGITRQTFYPNNTEIAEKPDQDMSPRFLGVPFSLADCCQFLKKAKSIKLPLKEDKSVSFTVISRHLPFVTGRSPYALMAVSGGKTIAVKSFVKDESIFNPVAVFLDEEFSLVSGRQFWLTDFVEGGGFYNRHYRGGIEIPEGVSYLLLMTTSDLLGSASSVGDKLIRHSLQGELVVRLGD